METIPTYWTPNGPGKGIAPNEHGRGNLVKRDELSPALRLLLTAFYSPGTPHTEESVGAAEALEELLTDRATVVWPGQSVPAQVRRWGMRYWMREDTLWWEDEETGERGILTEGPGDYATIRAALEEKEDLYI